MKRNQQSRPAVSHFLIVSLIASAAFAAHAQTENPTPQPPPLQSATAPMSQADHGARTGDRTAGRGQRMQARIAQRLAALKDRLDLAPQQEGAWETFASAMQPSSDALNRMASMRTERDTLTTPERIDRMRALRSERDAAMDKRFDATKAFYAELSAEQQKTFDANAQRDRQMGRHRRHHGRHGNMHKHGSHHGADHHEDNSRGVEREGS